MWQWAAPVAYALFVWWFSTGLIIWLDNLSPRTFPWSLGAATLVWVAALLRIREGAGDASVTGAYAAFTYGVLAWGWHEMSFFMGALTGPRRAPCPMDASAWLRFRLALATCIYHELGILVSGAFIVACTWHMPNQVALWTFAVLWVMRISAKLNVFAGVRNLNEQFLPAHLGYLSSYMRRRPMNLFFPFSVTVSTLAFAWLLHRVAALGDAARVAGLSFVATMLLLAIVEHWFLVLPLPFAELWAWAVRVRTRPARLAAPPVVDCAVLSVPSSR